MPKMFRITSSDIPTPVSLTVITTSLPSRFASTSRRPPDGVYRVALLRRLLTICVKRAASASSTMGSSATRISKC